MQVVSRGLDDTDVPVDVAFGNALDKTGFEIVTRVNNSNKQHLSKTLRTLDTMVGRQVARYNREKYEVQRTLDKLELSKKEVKYFHHDDGKVKYLYGGFKNSGKNNGKHYPRKFSKSMSSMLPSLGGRHPKYLTKTNVRRSRSNNDSNQSSMEHLPIVKGIHLDPLKPQGDSSQTRPNHVHLDSEDNLLTDHHDDNSKHVKLPDLPVTDNSSPQDNSSIGSLMERRGRLDRQQRLLRQSLKKQDQIIKNRVDQFFIKTENIHF